MRSSSTTASMLSSVRKPTRRQLLVASDQTIHGFSTVV